MLFGTQYRTGALEDDGHLLAAHRLCRRGTCFEVLFFFPALMPSAIDVRESPGTAADPALSSRCGWAGESDHLFRGPVSGPARSSWPPDSRCPGSAPGR